MPEEKVTIGFVGLGRLGLPIALNLVAGGYDVAGCERGRSAELIAAGGRVAGDGSSRAVAEVADVVLTCLPDDAALELAIESFLTAERPAPTVIDLSTVSIDLVSALHDRLVAAGGQLLDCPVSGTPAMAAEKQAVIFASGDRDAYDRVSEIIQTIAPKNIFVGALGAGTSFKHVANLLAFVHVTAAAEAMAFAATAGLDLGLVAEVISQSPGATSGQFNIRAPMMAAGNFDGKLVTVDQTREVVSQIAARADEIGAYTPLLTVVRELLDDFSAGGDGGSEPGKLMLYLKDQAPANA
jgi:3-hydroxyisobutyrate dehydrogenase-like beta-hydroxyacid dehydrogenase